MHDLKNIHPFTPRTYELHELNPEQYPATYTFPDGYTVPVKCYTEASDGKLIPVLGMRMMSDNDWQLKALNDRLERREVYEALGEDVDSTIAKLRAWFLEYESAI